MAQVSFICKRTVVGTKAPVKLGKFHPLSVLDRIMEGNYLHIVFYYQSSVERNPGDLTKKLIEALAETLSAFPVITGRLVKTPEDHWTIKCNDAGMRMIEARAKGSVCEWLQNLDSEKELKLVHWEEMFRRPYFWSTFYVQVTEFEEGGVAIGLSCSHMVSDPLCATMLLKAWADVAIGGKMITPPLFHPLPGRRPGNTNVNHQPYEELIDHYNTCIENPPNPTLVLNTKQVTITLRFDGEMIRKCIAKSASNTPFEAMAALFWVVISKVKGFSGGDSINMSICLDARKMLGLDHGFFGNCMVWNKVSGDGVQTNELSKAANAIKQVVEKMDTDGIIDLIEWFQARNTPWMNDHDLVCVNLQDVDSYSAIFEDNAQPLHTSYYVRPVIGEGQILILPDRNDALGRVVMITLAEDEANKLLEDALIHEFAPTILMGLSKMHA